MGTVLVLRRELFERLPAGAVTRRLELWHLIGKFLQQRFFDHHRTDFSRAHVAGAFTGQTDQVPFYLDVEVHVAFKRTGRKLFGDFIEY